MSMRIVQMNKRRTNTNMNTCVYLKIHTHTYIYICSDTYIYICSYKRVGLVLKLTGCNPMQPDDARAALLTATNGHYEVRV